MFWNNKKNVIEKLQKEVSELIKKSSVPTQDTIISYSVPLYNLSNKSDIAKALEEVPELSSIIKYMSNSFSFGVFKIYKEENEIENNISELLKYPNVFQSETEFKQGFAENILSYGVAYIFLNSKGLPEFTKGLSILDSSNVSPYVGDIKQKDLLEATDLNKLIKHIEYTDGTETVKIETENVLIVTLNTNVYLKNKRLNYVSPLKPLESALKVTPAMYDSMQNLMNNGGAKGFIVNKVSTDYGVKKMSKEDTRIVQTAYKDYGSKSGQKDVAIVNHDVDYVQISSRLKDMMLQEQQIMIKTIIADVMGFDIAILNSNNANKYKSTDYQEARKSMYNEKLFPIAESLSSTLTNYFYKFSKEKIILDYSSLDVFSEDDLTKVEKTETESNYIISLNQSVILNEMKRENAISLLIINGYLEEDAQNLIQ